LIFLLNREHLLESSGHYASVILSSRYCVSLARASLAVGKNADIEAVDSTLDEHLGVLKYLLLISFGSKTGIIHKLFLCILILLYGRQVVFVDLPVLFHSNFKCKLIDDGHRIYTTHSYFILIHRSHPAVNADLPFHVLYYIM
jgi:hypothetical protein